MLQQTLALWRAFQDLSEDAAQIGFRPFPDASISVQEVESDVEFDRMVIDEELRIASRRLFMDEHYARAVEEAFKCLNNAVKKKSGKLADGADLMRTVFTPKNPILKLNKLRTKSQQDEQLGYMDIFAGCMTGIRNPRAHEHHLRDSREEALRLLSWADHLMRMAKGSIRTRTKRAR
jgi:uncharacterized protein (TIGR02391 family)